MRQGLGSDCARKLAASTRVVGKTGDVSNVKDTMSVMAAASRLAVSQTAIRRMRDDDV
jgi:hypothetical protein